MIQSFLQSSRDQLRARYQATPMPAFFAWWGGELSSLVPEALTDRMMPPKPELWIVPAQTGGGDLRIVRPGGDEPLAMDVLGAGENASLLANRWQDLLAEFTDGQPEIRLCLPAEQCLALPVELPVAVEGNLRQALTYQLDQLSPFQADQVYFDQRVRRSEHKETDARTHQIQVELRLVPRPQLEPLLERLAAIGIEIHCVDTLSDCEDPMPEGFNLLPKELRARYVHARARFNTYLALGLLAVLGLVMFQSLWLREQSLDQLQAEADRLRVEARQVMQLQQELDDSLLAANFLSDRRARQPAAIELLAEMTRIMPGDIWLQRFQIQEDQVVVQGLADGSQRVIEIMNESELLDSPGFQGPIRMDPNSGQENFTTTAVLLPSAVIEANRTETVDESSTEAASSATAGGR
ncbi:MAG: PilN domain-containing protein [Pseudomonadota bacterium]